jgi:hypothetical protein
MVISHSYVHCWSVVERWFRDYLLRPMNGNPVFNQDNKIRDDISGLTAALVVVKMSTWKPGWGPEKSRLAGQVLRHLSPFPEAVAWCCFSRNQGDQLSAKMHLWVWLGLSKPEPADLLNFGVGLCFHGRPGKEGTPWWNGIRMDSLCRPSLAMCALALRLGVQGWLILLGKLRQGDGILQVLDADLQTLDLPHFFHV